MKKYRIVQEINKEGDEYFWIEERFMLLFWNWVECGATLNQAKKVIDFNVFLILTYFI